jgi:broad specificity phosphatase PhoE
MKVRPKAARLAQVFLIRHGQTAWSESGRHTSRSEIPLNAAGRRGARQLAAPLRGVPFAEVLVSPRDRAQETCERAGLGRRRVVEPDLAEWDYGDYEGLTSAEILRRRPGWNLFRQGCPGGESPAQVSRRADQLLARLRRQGGNIALFSHGHFGRVLAARWMRLPVAAGERLLLDPASLSIFGHEHKNRNSPVLALWNAGAGRKMVGAARFELATSTSRT